MKNYEYMLIKPNNSCCYNYLSWGTKIINKIKINCKNEQINNKIIKWKKKQNC